MDYCKQGESVLQGPIKEFPSQNVTQYLRLGLTSRRIQPTNLAVVNVEKQLTFKQLDDISTQIANVILKTVEDAPNHNSDGDRLIGVCMEPSDRLITILFGILKAGAAYVPFDIVLPKDRIGKIVNNCRPLLVICDGKRNVLNKFEPLKNLTNVLSIDELTKKLFTLKENVANNNNVGADETAIVLYTSGSSGEPKGVRLTHKAILNRLEWQWERFPFVPNEKCAFKTALTFVDSVAEIFGPLLQGFPIIVFDKTVTSQPSLFMEKLRAYDITRVVVVPSLLKAIFQTLDIFGKNEGRKLLSSVRLWVCSGETLSYDLLTEFFEIFPEEFTLCNFYGSTEVMGDVTFVSFTSLLDVESKVFEKKVPIGYPLVNTAVYILDENLQPVQQGRIGEIFVAGSNLSKGYVGFDSTLKFLNNPCSDYGEIYRTGDFGSIALLPNGESALMYEGRIDSQIKVRGQRVDLSEIELIISSLKSVSKVKVICHHPGQADQTIVAFIVTTSSQSTSDNLSKVINELLREHERPVVRLVDEIPLLLNGKTDRQHLLNIYAAELENREVFDDWNSLKIPKEKLPVAKSLFKIISAVTGSSFQTIAENLDDSFFNIGGTSLNAVVTIVKLREIEHYIRISDFTSAQTMREILMRITSFESEQKQPENEQYSVKLLTGDDKTEAIHIISISFARKGDLEAYVNVSYTDFANMIKSIWEPLLEKQFSFIVRRRADGKPVAVGLNFDVYDEPAEAESTKELDYVMGLLESVESQQRPRLPQGKGKLLHSFMMGVSEDLDESERVSLIELMEEQNLLIAREHNFEGIFTTNSNPLTKQIGRENDYEILNEYQVNNYVAPDGEKPFGLAPDSFKIICCWKKLA